MIQLPGCHKSSQAVHAETIPLSAPVKTTSGRVSEHLTIGTGTTVVIPIRAINRSEEIWGVDAKEFRPERWIGADIDKEVDLPPKVRAYKGYHHLLSFLEGPRICLGRLFAVAEFKVSRTVLSAEISTELKYTGDLICTNSQLYFRAA